MSALSYWMIPVLLSGFFEARVSLNLKTLENERVQALILLTEEDFTCPLCMHELFNLGDSLRVWEVPVFCIFIPGWRGKGSNPEKAADVVSSLQVEGWMATHLQSWKLFIDQQKVFVPLLNGSCIIFLFPEHGVMRWRLPVSIDDCLYIRNRLRTL